MEEVIIKIVTFLFWDCMYVCMYKRRKSQFSDLSLICFQRKCISSSSLSGFRVILDHWRCWLKWMESNCYLLCRKMSKSCINRLLYQMCTMATESNTWYSDIYYGRGFQYVKCHRPPKDDHPLLKDPIIKSNIFYKYVENGIYVTLSVKTQLKSFFFLDLLCSA